MPRVELDDIAANLVVALNRSRHTIVFAESCTAGLISATLGRVAGVSSVMAGSAVVYQLATKTAWLNVAAAMLDDPGPVSRDVAEVMAINVLNRTAQASIAASVTGHLGPDAPPELDGVAWTTVAVRNEAGTAVVAESRRLLLSATHEADSPAAPSVRHARQTDAVRQVLQLCLQIAQK